MRVVVILRHYRPGRNSIERVFYALAPALIRWGDVELRTLPCESTGFWRRLVNVVYVARYRRRTVHISGDCYYAVLGASRRRSIVTFHDAVSVHRLSGWRKRALVYLWYRIPSWWATHTTAISVSAARDIERETGVSVGSVIPNPLTLSVSDSHNGQCTPGDPSHRHRVLLVGTAPNKNLERCLEALSPLDLDVTIVGGLSPKQADLVRDTSLPIDVLVNLSDIQLAGAFQSACVLLFPSLYEGFGLPVIEAQAMSTPVITSALEPMLSVAGSDGALFLNPERVSEIREAVTRVLADKQLREKLVAAGVVNTARFEPASVAKLYTDLYASTRTSVPGSVFARGSKERRRWESADPQTSGAA